MSSLDAGGASSPRQPQPGPTPHRPGGPPIWGGGSAPAALERAGRYFDGWFPTGPDAKGWGQQWRKVQEIAQAAGRKPSDVEAAVYLTLAVDDDAAKAEARLNEFLSAYYGQRPDVLKKRQACFSGSASAAAEFLNGYIREAAGTSPSQEIATAKGLLADGTITPEQFERIKTRALASV